MNEIGHSRVNPGIVVKGGGGGGGGLVALTTALTNLFFNSKLTF